MNAVVLYQRFCDKFVEVVKPRYLEIMEKQGKQSADMFAVVCAIVYARAFLKVYLYGYH